MPLEAEADFVGSKIVSSMAVLSGTVITTI